MHGKVDPTFAAHPLIQREASRYAKDCACTHRIEAGRAALHRSLEKVLVIDMRMPWNGIGNSLTRWLAVLRVGTASGRATFLWFSDRSPSAVAAGAKTIPPELAAAGRLHGRRLRRFNAKNWARGTNMYRPDGFDLGDYFVAVGADYRWSRAAYRRVAAAMAARNISSPTLINYVCLRHTWACMNPMLEIGPMMASTKDPGLLSGGFAQEPERVNCTHEAEKDGFIVSFLASRTEPWLLLRLNEQTAIEPSAPAAAAVLSGAWPSTWQPSRPGATAPFWIHRTFATHACGRCLAEPARGGHRVHQAPNADAPCVYDAVPKGNWRPTSRPSTAEAELAWSAAETPDFALGALRGMRALRRLKKGARSNAFAGLCEGYSVLRPRRWLQRAMLPVLDKMLNASRGGPLVGVHLRSGFADWQWYSGTGVSASARGARDRVRARSEWGSAQAAGTMDYAEHWRTFESMLYDCKELNDTARPCFNWRIPHNGKAAALSDAVICAKDRLGIISRSGLAARYKRHGVQSPGAHHECLPIVPGGCLSSLDYPGNGPLSSVIECSRRAAVGLALSRAQSLAKGRPAAALDADAADSWGFLVLGDAPGFGSLVHSLQGLAGRVVNTNDKGAVAHTTFTGSCPPNSNACLPKGTIDPNGGWTRAMIDFYTGGLVDGFISTLFSSFTGAVLRRTLICCQERFHFGAMYSQQRSHRDRPMRDVGFLRSLMQTVEQKTAVEEWSQETPDTRLV